ncbi:MAG: NUDIX domain-containing protein [Pseudomonadota bacterium]
MGDEYLEIANEDDEVIGLASREESHKNGLIHRSVHIFVFNSKGELFIQKRGNTKDQCPLFYDSSAAGHVDRGESYYDCATRELKEELGIEADIKKLATIKACQETGWEHVNFFLCYSDDQITLNPDEIETGAFCSIETVQKMLKNEENRVTPSFRKLFGIWLEQNRKP